MHYVIHYIIDIVLSPPFPFESLARPSHRALPSASLGPTSQNAADHRASFYTIFIFFSQLHPLRGAHFLRF